MASQYQQLELNAHAEFDDEPSQDELSEYLERRIEVTNVLDPVSISLAALAISTAGLMLQGWQTYQASLPQCPECGRPVYKTNEDRDYECIKGHVW